MRIELAPTCLLKQQKRSLIIFLKYGERIETFHIDVSMSVFYGGEPLLRMEQIKNIVSYFKEKASEINTNSAQIQISNEDYEVILRDIPTNSFVYLDPPYHPVSESSNFTGYVQGGWNEEDQIRLRDTCNILNNNGIKFILSNSTSDFIREIYSDYNIHIVQANRAVNSNPSKRGQVDEFLIRNYE